MMTIENNETTSREFERKEHAEQKRYWTITLAATITLGWFVYKATDNVYWVGVAVSAVVIFYSMLVSVCWSITGDFKVLAEKLKSR